MVKLPIPLSSAAIGWIDILKQLIRIAYSCDIDVYNNMKGGFIVIRVEQVKVGSGEGVRSK